MKYGVRACTLAMLVILQACSLTACSGQNNNVAQTPFPQKSPASSISNDFSKVIPDKKFAACLVSVLNASNKGFPSVKASKIKNLSFTEYTTKYQNCSTNNLQKITSVEGLQHFTGLISLDLSEFKSLKELPQIESMTSLTQINLQGTKISDISALAHLSTLQNIALSDKSCNLTPLSRLSPITISAQCPTVDLSPLDGKKIQIYVSESISVPFVDVIIVHIALLCKINAGFACNHSKFVSLFYLRNTYSKHKPFGELSLTSVYLLSEQSHNFFKNHPCLNSITAHQSLASTI